MPADAARRDAGIKQGLPLDRRVDSAGATLRLDGAAIGAYCEPIALSTVRFTVYEEPGESHLSLLQELARRPTTAKVLPEEDQLTIALGWLCDHSQAVARAIVERFFTEMPCALKALSQSAMLGARVQIRLPPLAKSGPLWADLSICGDGQSFQLLIESKLGSSFHAYQLEKKRIFRPSITAVQPDAYLAAWRACGPSHEAAVRRVGTIRLDGEAPERTDPWRAADLTWADLYEVVSRAVEDGNVELDARLFAQELSQHLRERVLTPVYDAILLERGRDVSRGLGAQLSKEVDALATKRSTFALTPKATMEAAGRSI